jgi:hypothetical protein
MSELKGLGPALYKIFFVFVLLDPESFSSADPGPYSQCRAEFRSGILRRILENPDPEN